MNIKRNIVGEAADSKFQELLDAAKAKGTVNCPHCQKEIPRNLTRCTYCAKKLDRITAEGEKT